jgi:hypothetical protein
LATVLAGFLIVFSTDVFTAEVERINPPGIYKYTSVHAGYYRAGWQEEIFVAGQTPSDMDYKCVAPGDCKAQYIR